MITYFLMSRYALRASKMRTIGEENPQKIVTYYFTFDK